MWDLLKHSPSNMKRLLILLLWAIPCFATTYSTSFPATETPISEGGKWVNGGSTRAGLDQYSHNCGRQGDL